MKKLLIFMFVFAIQVFAQEEDISLDNKYALQFQLSSNFTLSSFQGTTLSGKYHFPDNLALRVGLSVTAQNREGTGDLAYQDENYLKYPYADKSDAYGIDITVQLIKYFPVEKNWFIYAGGGPFISGNKENSKRDFESDALADEETENKVSEAGVKFSGGVEWLVSSNIGIMAEYGFNISWGSSKSKSYNYSTHRNSDWDFFRIQTVPVKVGISVYF
ncbi:MAG: hypothetical protein R6W90_01175 [Ignavibacteriaceae bacterium]